MPTAANPAYTELCAIWREAATLVSIGQTLSWDQEIDMPPKAAPFRAEQLAMISRLAHQRHTSPRLGELLAACEADKALLADPLAAANLREARRDYDRATKLPTELVTEITETNSRAMHVWREAREKKDFKRFEPWLEKQVSLNRRKAECYGAPKGGELYDALLEDYEPGLTSAQVETVFKPLRASLVEFIGRITAQNVPHHDAVHRVKIPIEKQKEFNKHVAVKLGYDIEAGMLAVSAHPFSEGLAPGDTRMTTKYREDHFPEALATTLHESGHSLYEQGLPKSDRFGQPLAQSISLGVHESQSRMYENQLGRSLEFWQWCLPVAKQMLGAAIDQYTPEDLYRAMNIIKPRLIRVYSDEATYHLHIMLRFDLERALIRGDLKSADVPKVWNERMKKDLGVDVPHDGDGCLQDIHWSMGAIGYFPTYTLGTLYAAQYWDTINAAIPGLKKQIASGEFAPLLAWLRENIHAVGRLHRPADLCKKLTGKPLSHQPLMAYLEAKLAPLYGL